MGTNSWMNWLKCSQHTVILLKEKIFSSFILKFLLGKVCLLFPHPLTAFWKLEVMGMMYKGSQSFNNGLGLFFFLMFISVALRTFHNKQKTSRSKSKVRETKVEAKFSKK